MLGWSLSITLRLTLISSTSLNPQIAQELPWMHGWGIYKGKEKAVDLQCEFGVSLAQINKLNGTNM